MLKKLLLILGLLLLPTLAFGADPGSWDLLDEDCSDISDWADNDIGDGVSQVDPAGQFDFDSVSGSSDQASRNRDVGEIPTSYTVEIKAYHDSLGTHANLDVLIFQTARAGQQLNVRFASDGMFITDGASFSEVGTDIVATGEWIIWRILVDVTGGDASATCDVYKNSSLIASSIDCSQTGTYTDGLTNLVSLGATTQVQNHFDYVKIASGLYAPSGDVRRIISCM